MTSPLRVLCADDDAAIARVVLRGLSRAGFQVVCVATAEAACERLDDATDRFDVAVVDCTMAVPGGASLPREMASRHPELPLILVSGHVEGRDLLAISGLRNAVFLRKPFTLAKLVESVRAAVARDT